jgi:hypothetical protein
MNLPAAEIGGDGPADSLSGTRDDNTIQFHGVLKISGEFGKRAAFKPAPSKRKSDDDNLRNIELKKLFSGPVGVNDYSGFRLNAV